MTGWGDWTGFGYMSIFWMLFVTVFWVVVVILVVLAVRALTSQNRRVQTYQEPAPPRPGPGTAPRFGEQAPARPEALRVLEERYARGEIDREEFLSRKKDLLA
ncbi:MAG: SHOCT domain-containing protein [Thermoleophilia bacterium]|nr:SHOCT domain-containing protein [Thermoleophilia bacterium]